MSPPAVRLKVFIGYGDLPAFRKATAAVGEAMRSAGRRVELEPFLWRFEQLASSHWRDRALHAALEADIVAIACSHARDMTPAVDQWINGLLRAAQGRRTTLVVITSPSDAWTISVEQPQRIAKNGVVSVHAESRQKLVA